MPRKTLVLALFGLTALAQWALPGGLIWKKERILREGRVFKFALQGRDPMDFFRGSYVRLRFSLSDLPIPSGPSRAAGKRVFVVLKTDKDGYADIDAILPDPPRNTRDFVEARAWKDYRGIFHPYFPFNRFYLEEELAKKAGKWGFGKPGRPSYALVRVRDGDAVVVDVVLRGVSLTSLMAGK